VKYWILHPEGALVKIFKHHLPRAGNRESGDDSRKRREETLCREPLALRPLQPAGIMGRMPDVDVRKDKKDEEGDSKEPDPGQQDRKEDLLVADGDKPVPVAEDAEHGRTRPVRRPLRRRVLQE